jgi:hypothetical protein
VTLRAALLGLILVAGFAFFLPYLSDVKDGPDIGAPPNSGASLLPLERLSASLHSKTVTGITFSGCSRETGCQQFVSAEGAGSDCASRQPHR